MPNAQFNPATPLAAARVAGAAGRGATIAGGAFGNLIEWYDFTIYALLASVFAPSMFPAHNPVTSLLAVLATFALGFLVRPLGAILLSPLADRVGRRRVLSLTIMMMGVGSLIVAATPSFAAIGIAAPVLLLIARLIQGFSAGGEFQGSAVFLVEHAPADRRALAGSTQMVSIGLAILLATGTAALTTRLIPQPALGSWGWRLPFLLGALLSLWGVYLRWRLPETPLFVDLEQRRELARRPMVSALREHPRASLFVFVYQMGTVQFYIWAVFLPTYAHLAGGLPVADGLIGGTIALVAYTATVPVFAALSDRIGRKPLLYAPAIGFFLLSYPLLMLLRHGGFATFLFVDVVGLLLLAMSNSILAAVLCEVFPTRVRASGIGVPYAVCSAIFGGTAPLVATALVSRHLDAWLAFYIMAICLIALVVYLRVPETRGQLLD